VAVPLDPFADLLRINLVNCVGIGHLFLVAMCHACMVFKPGALRVGTRS